MALDLGAFALIFIIKVYFKNSEEQWTFSFFGQKKYNDFKVYMVWSKLGQFKEGPQNLHELHVCSVYEDDDFISEVKGVASRDEYARIASKYHISVNEVSWYLNPHRRPGEIYRPKKKPFRAVDREDGMLTIQFDINITKEDYLEAWKQWIVPLKGKAPQPKLPVHNKLLYAIFKAREQRGESFNSIFQQYENGTLPGYSDSNKMFASNQKKLEEYYRKYRIS